MLASTQNGYALHTVGGLDEMAAEPDHVTHDESELLQAQSLAARGLDDDLAAGLRQRRLGARRARPATCATSATALDSRPPLSGA